MKKKGFTLAEMLIVVAIIAILVAITTVTISNALEKSREATDMANIKTAMTELAEAAINGSASGMNGVTFKKADSGDYYQKIVYCTQKIVKWQSGNPDKNGCIYINEAKVGVSSNGNMPPYWYVRYYISGTNEGLFKVSVKSVK